MHTKKHNSTSFQKMLTVKEIASIFNIHASTVRRWEKERLLKSYSIGPNHNIRFKQEDISNFLEKSRNSGHKEHDLIS